MYKAIRIAALLLVVAAVALAAIALLVGRRSASATDDAPVPARAAAPVQHAHRAIVAAGDLQAGKPLASHDLQERPVPDPVVGGVGARHEAVGRVPIQDIPAGTPLRHAHFARGFPALLTAGERALAIPVDELAGAGNRIAPGDYVDVFVSLRPEPSDSERAAPQARLLLSRVKVLGYGATDLAAGDPAPPAETPPPAPAAEPAAADRRAQAIAGDAASSSPEDDRKARAAARTALLAVPVEQVNALLLGAQNGKLFLGLRHPGDDGVADASLFPAPRAVIAPQAGLTQAQREAALHAPENNAYSGIDLRSLSGHGAPRTAPVARARAATGGGPREAGIEIIRGDGHGAGPGGRR